MIFYVEYYNKFHNPDPVFKQLPHKLQIDLYQQAYGKDLLPIIEPFGYTQIRKLCHGMKQVNLQPEVLLFRPQPKSKQAKKTIKEQTCPETFSPDLMIKVRGILEQWTEWQPGNKEFLLRDRAKHYNCYQFLTGTRVRFGLRSKSIVQTVILSRNHFKELLSLQPLVERKVAALREAVLSNDEKRSLLQDECQACEETDHNVLTCPDVHYVLTGSARAISIGKVLTRKEQSRVHRVRRMPKSEKVRGLMHYSMLLGRMSFNREERQEEEKLDTGGTKSLSATFLSSTIRNILGKVQHDSCGHCSDDSVFDNRPGTSLRWTLPYESM